MAEKTPVTRLMELCVKNSIIPKFDEAEAVETKTFRCVVTAFSMCIEGTGTSKKLAKHNSAERMLRQLQGWDQFKAELADIKFDVASGGPSVDPVSDLTNMCIVKAWPTPWFIEKDRRGPPHLPEFTFSCTVGIHSADGMSTNKKKAKKTAAEGVLKLIEAYEKANPTVPAIKEIVLEPTEDVIAEYRRLKKQRPRKVSESLADRHRTLETFPKQQVAEAQAILRSDCLDEDITAKDKVYMICYTFDIEPVFKEIGRYDRKQKLFEMRGQCDYAFIGKEPEIWNRVIGFLKTMLNVE